MSPLDRFEDRRPTPHRCGPVAHAAAVAEFDRKYTIAALHFTPTFGTAAWLTSYRPMAPFSAGAAWRRSCATQLTFLRSALMLFALAFDPIFVLMAIVR